MENFNKNKPQSLPFVCLKAIKNIKTEKVVSKMLCIKLKKFLLVSLLMFVVSSVLFATNSFAAEAKGLFGDLTSSGVQIFTGMREIIFAVSGFGIVAVAIGGFFGNLNWKWLSAIIIGLVVIATTAAIINYMVDSDVASVMDLHDTLVKADDTKQ